MLADMAFDIDQLRTELKPPVPRSDFSHPGGHQQAL